MAGTEIANAYIALYTQMPGVKRDIERSLGGSDVQDAVEGAGRKSGSKFSAGLAGAVGGAVASLTTSALSVVGRSIDGAIARVDIMNNFPKIMQNLGYSSDDAAESIEDMSDRLTGLPTTLDHMAGVVQQLAPLTDGLDEATDLSLALNNALLAGGKDATAQANAMEQYSQMLAFGAVDMQSWRSMLTAMPGQMDQIAQSMLGAGNNSMDLYDALKEGEVGFDEFNDAILRLNNEGLGEYASFAEQAMDATDGIATQQANMQTAVTRGLAEVIQEAEPLIKGFLELGTELAKTLFPMIADGVGWLSDALSGVDFSEFANIVTSVSPLGIVFKAITPILPKLIDLFMQIGEALMPIGEALVAALIPAFEAIIPVIMAVFEAFLPVIAQILPILVQLISQLTPIVLMLIEAFIPLLEPILALIAPLMDLVMSILPPLLALFNLLIASILPPLEMGLSILIPIITGIVEAISTYLIPIIDTISNVLDGLTEFLTGVFTGNWEQAWDGIVSIFTSIWDGMQDIAKGAVNFIIDLINGVISAANALGEGLSSITGGAIEFTIPTIPHLAAGATVLPRRGGTLAVLAEAGRAETVVDTGLVNRALEQGIAGTGGGQNGPLVEVHAAPGMDEREIGQIAANEVAWAFRGA